MNTQTFILSLGAVLMVVGVVGNVMSVGNVFPPLVVGICAAAYAVGTLLFAAVQFRQTYEGSDLTMRRLRNIQVIGCVALILSGLMLFEQTFGIVKPLVATTLDGYNAYYHYVHGNWGVLLLIAGILELYTTLRMGKR